MRVSPILFIVIAICCYLLLPLVLLLLLLLQFLLLFELLLHSFEACHHSALLFGLLLVLGVVGLELYEQLVFIDGLA